MEDQFFLTQLLTFDVHPLASTLDHAAISKVHAVTTTWLTCIGKAPDDPRHWLHQKNTTGAHMLVFTDMIMTDAGHDAANSN